jgi:rubrerythrin
MLACVIFNKTSIMSKQITESWWKKCLNDKEKLEHWLVGLYNNEKDAEERFIDFAETYCKDDKLAYETFIVISKQEANHAILVENIMKERGVELFLKSTKDGRYWRNTLPCVVDMTTAAAIGAYAEGLSLARMRVIIADPETPADLVELFRVIEPEESYHARILAEIATKHGMSSVKDCHDKGLEELGLKIRGDI